MKSLQRPTAVPFGLALFEESLRYFRLAREAVPDVEMYFRHEAMLLAERGQWPELAAVSQQRIRERPGQPWPWLTRGLSEHRRGMLAEAQASFDSGYARLPQADRARLTSISRLLQRTQSRWYDTLPPDGKRGLHELYWNTARPSLLLPVNPMQSEFRARMVYAELRFADDEMRRHGTDTHQGEIHMRYGPPDVVVGAGGQLCSMQRDDAVELRPTGATDGVMSREAGWNRSIRIAPARGVDQPALASHRIDSLSAQVVRFPRQGIRGRGGSRHPHGRLRRDSRSPLHNRHGSSWSTISGRDHDPRPISRIERETWRVPAGVLLRTRRPRAGA